MLRGCVRGPRQAWTPDSWVRVAHASHVTKQSSALLKCDKGGLSGCYYSSVIKLDWFSTWRRDFTPQMAHRARIHLQRHLQKQNKQKKKSCWLLINLKYTHLATLTLIGLKGRDLKANPHRKEIIKWLINYVLIQGKRENHHRGNQQAAGAGNHKVTILKTHPKH